jgi:hypothetical protein
VVAIEIGLDYDLTHLSSDVEKLLNSAVEYSYVVHLVRDAGSVKATEAYLADCAIKSAYASVSPLGASVKLLNDRTPQLRAART